MEWLASKGYDQAFGARPLKRLIQKEIQDRFAEGLLSGEIKDGANCIITVENGNLEIMGQKKLTLNNGNEYIRLSGVIRPEDISASNEVSSNRIAHASITYTGTGDVHDTKQPGWLGKALRVVSPF